MATFTFYWLSGVSKTLEGDSPEDALNRAGYGAGALPALDFFAPGGVDPSYRWDPERRTWIQEREETPVAVEVDQT